MQDDDLVRHLRRLKDESHRSLREIERATHISNSSLSRYLSGQSTPPWNAVVALCKVTGHDPRPLRPLWEAARGTRRPQGRAFDVERVAVPQRPARNDLPRDTDVFIARTTEVDEALRLARAGRAVAVDGMGGVGKTALVVHVAHGLTAEFPDCQLYVDLHGFTPGRAPVEPGEALLVLLRALDVPSGRIPDSVEERAALWRSELSGRRAVVVLDNAADAAHIRPLLPGAGRHAVLVTSRRRLVEPAGVEPLSLTALSEADAAELFRAAAGPGRAEQAAADAEALAELLRHCGHLPLAIRVAAARLRHRPAWGVGDLLEGDRESGDGVGMREIVQTSLDRLGPEQRRMFRLLGVAPGPDIEPYAAAALIGLRPSAARALLDDLVDAHLLEEPRARRYRLHDVLRQHAQDAAERDEPPADRRIALGRLTDFFVHALNVLAERLDGGYEHRVRPLRHPPADWPMPEGAEAIMAWYDAEAAVVRAVLNAAVARGEDDTALAMTLVIGIFLGRRADMAGWLAYVTLGIGAAERLGDRTALALLLRFRGIARFFLAQLEAARVDFEAALSLCESTGDTEAQLIALRRLAMVEIERDDLDRAQALCEEAEKLPRARSYPVSLGYARLGSATVLTLRGRPAEAAAIAEAELAVAIATEDPHFVGHAWRTLGEARADCGDAEGALEAFQEAVAIAVTAGHLSHENYARCCAADALSRLGRDAEALAEHEAALRAASDGCETYREIHIRHAYSRALLAAGELERAAEEFRRTLALAEEHGFVGVAKQVRPLTNCAR